MNLTILIPHWRTGRMTAYSVAQFLKYADGHDIQVIVIDNSYPHDSIEYLKPFDGKIEILPNKTEQVRSHGTAFDLAMPYVRNDYFVCAESDSFPTMEGIYDYYEAVTKIGFDSAGSLLELSGGTFTHPTGCIYKKSIWQEAKAYTDAIDYSYFPNAAVKNEFPCHLMVRNDYLERFITNPENFVELHKDYLEENNGKVVPKSTEFFLSRLNYYLPVCGVFHNGMGNSQEDIKTYQQRTIITEKSRILLDNKDHLIYRIGFEPGEWLSFWQMAMGKRIGQIPTEVKWLPGRFQQQQEYTLMENGFKHLWGVSAYDGCEAEDVQDVAKFKAKQMNGLYNSLPEHQKIHI